VSSSNLPAGITEISDNAAVVFDSLSEVDSNDVAVAITGNPLLGVTVSASPNNNLSPSDEVTYSISVVNDGSTNATNVNVVTPIPSYMQYVGSISSSVGTGYFDTINNQVVYDLGDLVSKATAELSFKAKMSDHLPAGNTAATFISAATAANALKTSDTIILSADAAPVLTLLKTQTGTTAYPAATLMADVVNSKLV